MCSRRIASSEAGMPPLGEERLEPQGRVEVGLEGGRAAVRGARRLRRQLSMAARSPRRGAPVASVIVVLVLVGLAMGPASSAQYRAHRELDTGET